MFNQPIEIPIEQSKTTSVIAAPVKYTAIDNTQYTFFAALMFMGALIIGWFIRSAFVGLTTSNKELKDSIEKLATVAQTIHDDLNKYKIEAAATYATKSEMKDLKEDLSSICALRHNRINGDNKDASLS